MRHRERNVKHLVLTGPNKLQIYNPCPLTYLREESNPSTEVLTIAREYFDDDDLFPMSRAVKRCVHEYVEAAYPEGPTWGHHGSWAVAQGTSAYLARLGGYDEVNFLGPGHIPERLDHTNATRKAIDKLRQTQPECQRFGGFSFVGELAESIAMLQNPFGIVEAMAKFGRKKYGKKRTRKMNLKRLYGETFGRGSGTHLEVAFGWLPFVSSLQDLGSSLANVAEDYTSYLEKQGSGPKKFKVTSAPFAHRLFKDEWVTYSEMHKVRCILQCEVRPSPETMGYGEFVANRMGFRPVDLLSAAWELTPFSFVYDWIIPIGRKLNDVLQLPIDFSIVSSQYDHTVDHIVTRHARITRFCEESPKHVWRRDIGRYYRRDGSPFLSGDAPLLTNNQALLSLSLLVQQLKGRLR